MRPEKLEKLYSILAGKRTLLILTHDNPDPDAIASGLALKHLLGKVENLSCTLAYSGLIGRAENKAMVSELGIEISPFENLVVDNFEALALVDTQPRFGNISLPPNREPLVVVDHHNRKGRAPRAAFWDIREDYGATSTIMYEYLRTARMGIDTRLATALFYAIKSETQDLGREAGLVDKEAYFSLFTMSEPTWIYSIANASVPREFFTNYSRAIDSTTIHDQAICTTLGEVQYPDLVAEVADMMLKMEKIQWSFCSGIFETRLLVSIRTTNLATDCSDIIVRMLRHVGSAGGHDMMAGGKIEVGNVSATDRRGLEMRLRARFLKQISMPIRGERLVGKK
ncbi:MAG: DHH family phosphoesterase [Planctomycetota bacterium]|nr:DHH family phosphoesterase [Planctomycetota bacterium]